LKVVSLTNPAISIGERAGPSSITMPTSTPSARRTSSAHACPAGGASGTPLGAIS
jgi:hypothetical protein